MADTKEHGTKHDLGACAEPDKVGGPGAAQKKGMLFGTTRNIIFFLIIVLLGLTAIGLVMKHAGGDSKQASATPHNTGRKIGGKTLLLAKDSAFASTPYVEIWRPEEIVRMDSMHVDTTFRRVALVPWIRDKGLKGRYIEYYDQTMEFRYKSGRTEMAGPGYADPTFNVDSLLTADVRIPPTDSTRTQGWLYEVQRVRKDS